MDGQGDDLTIRTSQTSRSGDPAQLENLSSSSTCLITRKARASHSNIHHGALIDECWWWWEIGAAATSTTSVLALVTVLVKIDGLLLDSWESVSDLQPSTVVSLLTTLQKSTMMLVVAACLSQLKWQHFASGEGQPLRHLQILEDASRGPWGSARLVVGMVSRSVIVWLLIAVTLAGLVVEPAAQQILRFHTETALLRNVTPMAGKATTYNASNGWATDAKAASDALNYNSRVLGAISGAISEPYFDCPNDATYCEWPDMIHTLGICSTIRQNDIDWGADLQAAGSDLPRGDDFLLGHVSRRS
ncbi:hypothetical protein VPNG_09102 [Cytospora leucostoma]|uniref:Uncharacterized protein n=1 Tax=Cytospora leucostoma TaxID=1230097 RepID=A0A423VP82_9PEZI|nr:hypothetical protein VPNG_09102 [Cytospora leucostoma]